MVFSLLLYKLLHLLGLSLLFGGMLTCLLLLRRERGEPGAERGAFVAAHLVAAPGLIIVLLTGFAQSFLHQWSEFKGAGYMHAKLLLVAIVIAALAVEIRGQGIMRRNYTSGPNPAIQSKWLSIRSLATSAGVAACLGIYILIVFRPF